MRFASSAGKSPISLKLEMCRSGRTSRCTSACGLMSRIATKPSPEWTWSPSAYSEQNRQSSGSENPLLGDCARSGTDEVSRVCLEEPGRVVVPVSAAGPVDQDEILVAELLPPVRDASGLRGLAQARASLLLHRGRDRVSRRRARARAGRIGKDVHLGDPRLLDHAERSLESGLVLGREAHDDVAGQVEALRVLHPPQERVGRIPAGHRLEDGVVPRLQRYMQVARDSGGLAYRRDQL